MGLNPLSGDSPPWSLIPKTAGDKICERMVVRFKGQTALRPDWGKLPSGQPLSARHLVGPTMCNDEPLTGKKVVDLGLMVDPCPSWACRTPLSACFFSCSLSHAPGSCQSRSRPPSRWHAAATRWLLLCKERGPTWQAGNQLDMSDLHHVWPFFT